MTTGDVYITVEEDVTNVEVSDGDVSQITVQEENDVVATVVVSADNQSICEAAAAAAGSYRDEAAISAASALASKNAALVAQTAAENAQLAAEGAQALAEAAQAAAETAQGLAEAAQVAAEAAQGAAETAQGLAEAAQLAAETAQGLAEAAQAAAEAAAFVYWDELGTALIPLVAGYNIGSATYLVGNIYQQDSGYHYFGSDQDGYIYHSGSHLFIRSTVGNVDIGTTAAGGTLQFVTLGNYVWAMTGTKHLVPINANTSDVGSTSLPVRYIYQGDACIHYFGNDQDGRIQHDGSDFWISSNTGKVIINAITAASVQIQTNNTARFIVTQDGDILPYVNNTYSVGIATYTIKHIYQGDSGYHYFGNDQDAYIYHSGTSFVLRNVTGEFDIRNVASANIYVGTNNTIRWLFHSSSGALAPYTTNATDVGLTTNCVRSIYQGDSGYHYFGDSQDAYVVFDGANFYVRATAGGLYLYTDSGSINFTTSGVAKWVIGPAGSLYPYLTKTYPLGGTAALISHIYQGDNCIHYFGDSQNASIYWNGTRLVILGQLKHVCIVSFGSDETVATGNGTFGFCVPGELDGWNLSTVRVGCTTAGSANTTDVQVRRVRSGSAVDMLSTKVTLSSGEYSRADGVVDTSNDDVNNGDMIFVDIDAVGTGTQGLSTVLSFQSP